jgi:hypothetical protein
MKPSIALIIAACFLVTSCASAVQPVNVHIPITELEPEHDEVETQTAVIKFYPNKLNWRSAAYRFKPGPGLADISCMTEDRPCTNFKVKIAGAPGITDGVYYMVQSEDDPKFFVWKNEQQQTLFYTSSNMDGKFKTYPTLKESQAHEHEGDGWRTAGKVAEYTLLGVLVVGLVVVLAAGAFAEGYNQAAAQNGY